MHFFTIAVTFLAVFLTAFKAMTLLNVKCCKNEQRGLDSQGKWAPYLSLHLLSAFNLDFGIWESLFLQFTVIVLDVISEYFYNTCGVTLLPLCWNNAVRVYSVHCTFFTLVCQKKKKRKQSLTQIITSKIFDKRSLW